MDVTITVRVCDRCKDRGKPATRYSLKPDGGEAVTRDLCDEDAAPVLAVFDLVVSEDSEPEPVATEARPPAQRAASAKKTTAKKTTAKKTTTEGAAAEEAAAKPRRRGRTPVKTLAEIEASKKAAAAKS
ncbi:hypothetical protein [Streptomyces viridochromogenes]|uniref:hypothetical protein n=1 Tax=Streptomyces viridochromogenes TaxID=1938 RepID=UPI00069F48E1|nr:hypothetical protein [Streptomyces viridochromogenes]KOG26827.1 hypothetical protein ADK36_02405 [Streptomyces viridochromogenes]